ncbi:RNA 2',3'-cyclic phosphodiesterase [Thiolapillus sp.]
MPWNNWARSVSGNKRLFFALWPDPEVRSRLADLQTRLPQIQGNWVHPMDLHVTLQFLGVVPANRQHCVLDAASAVQALPFVLEITRLDFWPKPRIAWAGPEKIPQELLQLVQALGQHLRKCGCKPEKRAYRPHVTLLRKTTPGMAQVLAQPVVWPVDHFVLVESRPGGEPPWYEVVETWPLS